MSLFWNRTFARLTDYGLFYLVGVLLSLVLPFEFQDSFYLSFGLAVPILWAPLEAFFLHRFGTTLGKKMFGIQIEGLYSWGQALKRAFFFPKNSGQIVVSPLGRGRYLLAIVVTLACTATLFLGKDLSDAAVEYEEQFVSTDGWIHYASDEGQFTVDFPKKPQTETHTFDVPNSDKTIDMSEIKATKKEATFSVSYLELPRKWRLFSAGTLLKGAMNVIISHMPGAELIEKKLSKYKNYPAMDFRLKQGDDIIEGRLILVGTTLYKLTVIYPPDAPQQNQHTPFLDSFELRN